MEEKYPLGIYVEPIYLGVEYLFMDRTKKVPAKLGSITPLLKEVIFTLFDGCAVLTMHPYRVLEVPKQWFYSKRGKISVPPSNVTHVLGHMVSQNPPWQHLHEGNYDLSILKYCDPRFFEASRADLFCAPCLTETFFNLNFEGATYRSMIGYKRDELPENWDMETLIGERPLRECTICVSGNESSHQISLHGSSGDYDIRALMERVRLIGEQHHVSLHYSKSEEPYANPPEDWVWEDEEPDAETLKESASSNEAETQQDNTNGGTPT